MNGHESYYKGAAADIGFRQVYENCNGPHLIPPGGNENALSKTASELAAVAIATITGTNHRVRIFLQS